MFDERCVLANDKFLFGNIIEGSMDSVPTYPVCVCSAVSVQVRRGRTWPSCLHLIDCIFSGRPSTYFDRIDFCSVLFRYGACQIKLCDSFVLQIPEFPNFNLLRKLLIMHSQVGFCVTNVIVRAVGYFIGASEGRCSMLNFQIM